MRKSIFVILIAIIALSVFAGFGWRYYHHPRGYHHPMNYRCASPTEDNTPPMKGLYALRLLQEYKEITLEGVVKDIVWIPGDSKIIVESDGKLYEVKVGPIWYLNIAVGDIVKIEGRLVVIDGKEYVIAEKVNDIELRDFGRPRWVPGGRPGWVPGW